MLLSTLANKLFVSKQFCLKLKVYNIVYLCIKNNEQNIIHLVLANIWSQKRNVIAPKNLKKIDLSGYYRNPPLQVRK